MNTPAPLEIRAEALLVKLRPYLEADGFDVIVESAEGESISLRLTGPVPGCASQRALTQLALQHHLLREIEELREVTFV